MKLDFARVQKLLKAFDFPTLFREELGWEPMRYAQDVTIGEETYHLDAMAHKRGFAALRCHGQIPPYAIRRKIDSQVEKSYHEHLIIYTDTAETTQVWQWVKRQMGKPAASREHTFRREQSGEPLLQKLEHLAVTLDEEDELTILDVAEGVRRGFDVERVTKRFYDRFKEEHAVFLKFVEGIPEEGLQRWYVSVTLNRLMFVYFIQKKGFLDGDPDYLRRKLVKSRKQGNDHFYTDFLCPLFFQGFAQKEHDAETVRLLGQVPFLNGGIFARHQIEELYGEKLQIPDKAFERLFGFFDEYQWHLDERPLRRDNEINPDVLGYIFEKYINQKQMGAYYTKEDITGYISKNTVLPHLFDAARALTPSPSPFKGEGSSSIWKLLQENPDRYIYKPVRHGISWNYVPGDINEGNALDAPIPLPPEIAVGLDDVSKRTEWNKPASEAFALPTEIWREVVSRRQRYKEVRERLAGGDVRDVNDLITYNLDIRQFAQDVIENAEAPKLLRAFWKAIRSVTVLDPTVGSGAFLFAALNILEPLYEACLERMQVFVDELEASGEPHSPEKFSDFRKVLAETERHPNRRYYVLKSIIVDNLYGVDIMDEAVEICKLRLFLKLVAQVERADQMEPLPDIDFNIRAGNTLVGFATKEDVRRAVQMGKVGGVETERLFMMPEDETQLKRIEEKAQDVERLFGLFHQQQTELGGEVRPEDKAELRRRLKELEDELNIHLARQYGIHDYKSREFAKWRESHKPFHWFVDFYGIMGQGGFNVIIGNPPYVNLNKIDYSFSQINYNCLTCGDLFALTIERSFQLNATNGRNGFIIPLSGLATDTMLPLRNLVFTKTRNTWNSFYSASDQPAPLFTGVRHRLLITLNNKGNAPTRYKYCTNFIKWFSEERPALFQTFVNYLKISDIPDNSKISREIEKNILTKLLKFRKLEWFVLKKGKPVYYHNAPVHWAKVFDFIPYYSVNGKQQQSTHLKQIYLENDVFTAFVICLLNSSLFYWYNWQYSNCRDLTLRDILNIPVSLDKVSENLGNELIMLKDKLMKDFRKHSKIYTRIYNDTMTKFDSFYPVFSKSILDEIDHTLGKHYGLIDEELDFVVNYDIKYRIGTSLDDNEEE